MIKEITIGPASLTSQNAFVLTNIDILKGNLELRETEAQTEEKYIICSCDMELTNKKGNELKRTIKKLVNFNDSDRLINQKTVRFTHEEK